MVHILVFVIEHPVVQIEVDLRVKWRAVERCDRGFSWLSK